MNSWFVKNLGDPMLADESLEHIKSSFMAQYKKYKGINDMAIFFRHESSGDVHCELMLYFTPATLEVAKALDAIPCEKPLADGLGLLLGAEETRALFYP